MPFSKAVSSSALLDLEQYDDDLAKIASHTYASTPQFEPQRSDRTETEPAPTTVPSVHRDDLRRMNFIGSGKFCSVYLFSGPSSLLNDRNNAFHHQESSNNERSSSDVQQRARSLFAFKSIDPSKVKSDRDLTIATYELANEAKILSQLDHQNIIKLRGISSEIFSQSYGSEGDGYFLVLDLLPETLCDRLQRWRRQNKIAEYISNESLLRSTSKFLQNSFSGMLLNSTRREHKQAELRNADTIRRLKCQKSMQNRIQETVLGIAMGMKYLHSHNIVLRDLKPANIGYCDTIDGSCYNNNNNNNNNEKHTPLQNNVRLFDFGMAQKVEECDSQTVCGSLRYMAPEVMNGKGYTLGIDVYSFGIILFEICSLQVPFAEYNNKGKQKKKLSNKSKRNRSRYSTLSLTLAVERRLVADFYRGVAFYGPMQTNNNLERIVPCPKIRKLIEECCDENPTNRPSFREILSRFLIIFNLDTATTRDDTSSTSSSTNFADNTIDF